MCLRVRKLYIDNQGNALLLVTLTLILKNIIQGRYHLEICAVIGYHVFDSGKFISKNERKLLNMFKYMCNVKEILKTESQIFRY